MTFNDKGEYQLQGNRFEVLYKDNIAAKWVAVVEATDRKLIGTEYIERNWRHTVWVFENEIWIPPDDDSDVRFQNLKDAYKDGTIMVWDDGTNQYYAMIVGFEVRPLKQGTDGYEGNIVLVLPYGKMAVDPADLP